MNYRMKAKSENTVHKNQDKAIQNSLKDSFAKKQEISLEDNRPEASLQRKLIFSLSESIQPIQRIILINGREATENDVQTVRRISSCISGADVSQIEAIFRERISTGNYQYANLHDAVQNIIATMPVQPTTVPVTASRQSDAPGRDTTSIRSRQAPPPRATATRTTTAAQRPGTRIPTVASTPTTRASEPIPLPVAPEQIESEYSTGLRMRPETETHIGFEIEPGGHYRFPKGVAEGEVTRFVNQTLAVFVSPSRPMKRNPHPAFVPVLEMIIDDPKTEDGIVVVQVEFRTVPLRFDQINQDLGTTIRSAINRFPFRRMLSSPQQTPVTIGTDMRRGYWIPTTLLSGSALLRRAVTESSPRMPATPAQHATTSIELSVFTKLAIADQQRLFPSIAGVTIPEGDRQDTLDRIAQQILSTPNIDATTRGRNAQSTMAKSPIESLLAADRRLCVPDRSVSTSVKVSDKREDTYSLGEMDAVSGQIRSSGYFPIMQGQEEGDERAGYRAVAEKLQPPLLDTVSHELRVLVEHRSSGSRTLVDAVNQALRGDACLLNEYAGAARRMDSLRRRVPIRREASDGSSIVPETEEVPSATCPAPVVAEQAPLYQPVEESLSLADLVRQHLQGIIWASTRGTFSAEYQSFQDNLSGVLPTLQRGGLNAATAAYITATLPGIINQHNPEGGHPEALIQEQIFDQLEESSDGLILPGHSRYLWALLRFFNSSHV